MAICIEAGSVMSKLITTKESNIEKRVLTEVGHRTANLLYTISRARRIHPLYLARQQVSISLS